MQNVSYKTSILHKVSDRPSQCVVNQNDSDTTIQILIITDLAMLLEKNNAQKEGSSVLENHSDILTAIFAAGTFFIIELKKGSNTKHQETTIT